ncbi:MAG: type I-E CRISPR-associated protein Cse2/CasB [Rhodobacteraceae bacterium]|nr:type I-E CRISPR-associated protein Cse2/CasB [Paracoccaceae bacterium]
MSAENSKGADILRWWVLNLADRQSGRARALSARLRRARGGDALTEPEVHDLARTLGMTDGARLALLVRLLAQVKEHVPQSLARRLGGNPPVLSTLRFQRLMRAEGDELPEALRRAITMAEGRCNVASLGLDILYWGEAVRARWCFHYFGAEAPSHTDGEAAEEISE